ncbi:thioredoxin family protein [Erythrobacter sp. SDW2]|uniref:protein-disulfide reductase DsbD family protein n=1 Tax=Erythrobacter sp. SDW2 TaxID=2907154 RepID=UPI001F1C7B8A|nr:protein-disulfide reductase DsbD domain-containing protein [Erythrobacter sp. SDW2]UIP07875.1 thioredoxin family protein [Erythrobacter sp. SDW2]
MLSARSTFSRIVALFALMLAALIAAQPAQAQETYIRASLLVEGPVAPGGEVMLALRFQPVAPEWHGYWKNPGDAGLGMQLEWDLPDGVTVGEPLYPVPKRLLIDGLMNHIFEGDYAVLVPLKLAQDWRGGDRLNIGVEAFYLACTDEICVPQDAKLSTTVPIGISDSDSSDFTQWRSALAPLIESKGTFEVKGELLRVAIPVPASLDVGMPHLFVGARELGDGLQPAYAAPQGFARKGDWLVAEVPLNRLVLPAGSSVEFAPAPDQIDGIIAWSDSEGLRFVAERGKVPGGGTRLMARDSETPALWLLLAGALLGGLLLNVMPCVFPILSLKALSLACAGEGEREARIEGLAYTAGVVLASVALGAIMLALRAAGEQVGWAFQLQEPAVVVALLALAVLITANLWGLFELPGLAISGGSTPRGAFTTGLLAAFVATPCTGPFMAAALGAALLLPTPVALLLFAALGLGLALPFLLLGFVPAFRNRLPKPGLWMVTFRKALAVPMALTALALIWLLWRMGGAMFAGAAFGAALGVVLTVVAIQKGQRPLAAIELAGALIFASIAYVQFAPTAPSANESVLESASFSQDALSEARATGQPLFVYFTADWCVSCKVNEKVAIEREATRAAFDKAGVITLRGDWTLRQPEITEFLSERGAAGVPLYLWYEPGAAEPEQLPQLLGPDSLIELAGRER